MKREYVWFAIGIGLLVAAVYKGDDTDLILAYVSIGVAAILKQMRELV